MRKFKIHIPKTKRFKTNQEYLDLLKLVVAEQDRQASQIKDKEDKDGL